MDVYKFSKPDFDKHQSSKLKVASKRHSILVDVNLNANPKIMALHAQGDYTLLPILLEIWANLDLSTKEWSIRADHFKEWAVGALKVNHRFDIKKRLQWLFDNELIVLTIEQTSNKIQTNLKQDPNKPQTTMKQDPCLDSIRSLETPQTQAQTETSFIYKEKEIKKREGEGKEIISPTPPQENFQWFKIKRPGITYPAGEYSEKDWLRSETLRYLRDKGHKINPQLSFDELLTSNSYAYELFNAWMRYPIAHRLAAYVYSVFDKKAPGPADYAKRALMGKWEGMQENIRQAEAVLKAGFEVTFDE